MPDKCVLMYRCGAENPGWLPGVHPSVAEGVVTRKVCYGDNYNCCQWSNNIKVKNCSSYYVYELQKPPGCKLRYCGNAGAVDGCTNYVVLSEADRAEGNAVPANLCDGDLVTGWYRFQGAAGDRMPDQCVFENHCGTSRPGWLSGAHPTVAEGVVTRKVCYSDTNSCCEWSNNIKVKNCSSYYVYELQKPPGCKLRYCGNSAVDGCKNYTVLSEADRAQGNAVRNTLCDGALKTGWYRFQGEAGDRMPEKCVLLFRCGTHVPVWLSGGHPTVAEGVVMRKGCFSNFFSCCQQSNNIKVKNCSSYYVYQLQRTRCCNCRYCGNAGTVDGCKNYTVLSEADRAQGNTELANLNDNNLVTGWYRFQGAAGDRMPDECVLALRCGTAYPGWISGAHPTVAEGVVTRKVCYSDYNSCCYWSNNIKVKNCSSYNVYELHKPPCCSSRYCGNAGTADGCKNYTVLSEADRTEGNTVLADLCDGDLVTGWYRFQGAAGDRMPDKCVPKRRCGTDAPGWINGSHPKVNEGVVIRKVCYHDYDSCCYVSNNIKVRNCGAFYVYELTKTPGCNRRYCGVITCPPLPAPYNGTRIGCPGNATMYNDTVCQFSCNNGYIGSGSQERRCQHNGTWSGQDFTCQIINCTSLKVDPAGPLRMSSCNKNYGSKCNFSCTIGYRLNGSSAVTCVVSGSQHPGMWNNTIPTCEVVTCPALPSPSNSVRHGCTGNATEYPYDTVCRFSCIEGYKASGSSVRRCQENGIWNGGEFSCERILCEPLQLAPKIRMKAACTRLPGDACEFACKRGYGLIGSDIRRCNNSGSWTGTQPRCEAVTCPTLSPPTNGELLECNTTEMLYDTVCRFSCNEGSEASGSTVRRCTENGTWSGNDLVCTDVLNLSIWNGLQNSILTSDRVRSVISPAESLKLPDVVLANKAANTSTKYCTIYKGWTAWDTGPTSIQGFLGFFCPRYPVPTVLMSSANASSPM
ncbi:hypothetical protein ACROYT_G034005 [Oculina patagonica]